jgi:hypothetical protein
VSTLWHRDRHTVWALNSMNRHRGHRGPPPIGAVWKSHGRTIIVAAPKLPYGRGTAGHIRASHLTSQVSIAWMRGTIMGAQVRWLCNGLTESFVFEAEPSLPLCRMCQYRAGDVPPVLIQVNINTVRIGGTT